MKKTLFLLITVALLCACTNQRSQSPKFQSYASNVCDWDKELRVTDVEFTDTATILTFFYKVRRPGFSLSILPQTYLSDEHGRRYKALFMVENWLGAYFPSEPDGSVFHVGFEPLPEGTRVFDMKEGEGYHYFQILGIHSSNYKPAKPKFSEAELKEAQQLKSRIFRRGAVTLRGNILGYSARQNYQTYKLIYSDYIADEQKTVSIDIDPRGHFETSFDVNSFMGASIIDNKNIWHELIAQPGDTLDITFLEDGSTLITLSDGRPYYLQNYNRIPSNVVVQDNAIISYESLDDKTILKTVQEWKKRGAEYVDYIATKYHLTAFEYDYARTMMENHVIERYLDYRMELKNRPLSLAASEGSVEKVAGKILSEKANRILDNPKGLKILADFCANDTLLLVLPVQWVIYNRYKYDRSFRETPDIPNMRDEWGLGASFAFESFTRDSAHMANDMKLFGAKEPSFFGKICMMQDIGRNLETLKTALLLDGHANPNEELYAFVQKVKGLLNDANLEARADQIFEEFIRTKEPYWELPDCRGKEVLSKILANYPGKYVYLDFWSTGCGPCIAGIKNLFNNNRKVMTGKHDKFVMVFITDDPVAAYEPFRSEWLDGAESYRISKDDYNSLAGMFNFSAIPHHELITPDGLAVTNVPMMSEVNPDNPEGK